MSKGQTACINLGLILGPVQARIFLPQEKFGSLRGPALEPLSYNTPHFSNRILGLMMTYFKAVPFIQFNSRPLQSNTLKKRNKQIQTLVRLKFLFNQAKISLAWWVSSPALELGTFLLDLECGNNRCVSLTSWAQLTTSWLFRGHNPHRSQPYPSTSWKWEFAGCQQHLTSFRPDHPVRIQMDNSRQWPT